MSTGILRDHLSRALAWGDAHVSFDDAVEGLEPSLRGVRPDGLPHSAWELLEHLRLAQEDLLAFCTREDYREHKWPDDYWPASPEPPSTKAWEESVAAYRADRAELQQLAADPAIELEAPLPFGRGHSLIRELLLVLDHAAYHVGQLVLVRQALAAWR